MRAERYRATRPTHGAAAVADIRASPDPESPRLDQLLFGEAFDVLDQEGDRVWGQARRDGVVGWMALADLAEGAPSPRGQVDRLDGELPLNALVAEAVSAAPVGRFADEPVAVAERLLGVPHAPGARSSRETDCAGLIQQALYACGRAGPRYADQQAELGVRTERAQARRGDLVVWPHPQGGPGWSGHSAFMLDADRVLHAVGDKGAVVIEDFAEADGRYRDGGFERPIFRRL